MLAWMVAQSVREQLCEHTTMHGPLDNMVAYLQHNLEHWVAGFHCGLCGCLKGSQKPDFLVMEPNRYTGTQSDPVINPLVPPVSTLTTDTSFLLGHQPSPLTTSDPGNGQTNNQRGTNAATDRKARASDKHR